MTANTPKPQDDSILIDYKTACRLLGIGKNCFFKLKATGKFPVPEIRLGGNVRYNKAQLLRWIDSNCSPAWRARKVAAR